MSAFPLEGRDPREVGPYRLTGRLGEGGQGVVYLAESPAGQQVAVKMLKIDLADPNADRTARRRLAEEVAAAMRVDEFCTAKVLDSSVEGPIPYVVSEYVDGPSLFDRVEARGPLGGGELTRLMITSVSGLAAIHGADVVHRDLKPSNVLLGPDGARVVDFGIARPASTRTHTGQLIGTPAYFAPEQLRGQSASKASDIFAWAGTMVFAAIGRPPFGQADYDYEFPALFERIKNDPPDLHGVPERLLPLLRLCLSKDPERRPAAGTILSRLVDPKAQVVDHEVAAPEITQVHEWLSGPGPKIEMPPPMPSPTEIMAAAADHPVPEPVPEPAPDATPGRTGPVAAPVTGEVRGGSWPGGDGGAASTVAPAEGDTIPPGSSRGAPRRRTWMWAGGAVAVVLVALGVWVVPGLGGGGSKGIPDRFGGNWHGVASETDGYRSTQRSISLTLAGGAKTGSLHGSQCAGDLRLEKTDGDRLTLRLTGGECEGGTVIATLDGGRMTYELRNGPKTGDGPLSGS